MKCCIIDRRGRSICIVAATAARYDPDAFDSMAVMNSETWNCGHQEEGRLTRDDIVPHVRSVCVCVCTCYYML